MRTSKNLCLSDMNGEVEGEISAYRLIVLGDSNGKVECMPEAGVVGELGVEAVNDNGRRVLMNGC